MENTQTSPQSDRCQSSAKAFGWKKPFEGGAGRVPLHRRGERSLKPSMFCLAGAKDACFGIQKPEHTVFSSPSLINSTLVLSVMEKEMLPSSKEELQFFCLEIIISGVSGMNRSYFLGV
jgi:hypothetical protein